MADAFDPKAFLAETAGFDPKAFLAESNPPAPAGPPPRATDPGAPKPPISGQPAFDPDISPRTGSAAPEIVDYAKRTFQPPKPVANDNPIRNTAAKVIDSATLGITRGPTAAFGAALEGLTDKYPGTTYGERRSNILRALEERNAQTTKDMGIAGPTVDAVASLPANYYLGGGRKAMSVAEMALRSMIPAGVEGASKNAESPFTMAVGAAKNAGVSAGLTASLGQAGKLLPGGRAAARADAQDARGVPPARIEADAANIYRTLDQGGFQWSGAQGRSLRQELANLRQTSQYDPIAHHDLSGYYSTLYNRARGPMTFKDLQNIKSEVAKFERGDDAKLRGAASHINRAIENFVARNPPAHNPNNINVSQLWTDASRLTRQSKIAAKAQADFDAPVGTALIPGKRPPELAQRDVADAKIKAANDPDKYSPHERDPEAMRLLANIRAAGDPNRRGPTVQSAAGAAGRFLYNKVAPIAGAVVGSVAPAAFGYSRDAGTALTAAAALGGGAVGAGAAAGLGKAAKSIAASEGQKHVNALSRYLTSGTTARSPYGSGLTREELARLMTEQNFARFLGQNGTRFVDQLGE